MFDTVTITAAAIQMDARIGDVSGNLERAARLVREAFQRGADWVLLPEFFTSPVGFHFALRHVALPPDGAATQLLCDLAREYRGVVGGSFVTAEHGDAYNRFVLAGPDGVLGQHDKDQPTMWENAYYVGGEDNGILLTSIGPVGAAVCWELVRTRTAARLRGRVRLVVGGSCWWTMPDWPLARAVLSRFHEENRELMQRTPGRLARLVGTPVVHASHCGRFECDTPLVPLLPFRSHYLGEAQIAAADGTLLARRTFEEGEGIALARVTVAPPAPQDALPKRFWIPELPVWARGLWTVQNLHGAREYQRVKAASGFNWQQPGWDQLGGSLAARSAEESSLESADGATRAGAA
jgi:predicted amidohydrolase